MFFKKFYNKSTKLASSDRHVSRNLATSMLIYKTMNTISVSASEAAAI